MASSSKDDLGPVRYLLGGLSAMGACVVSNPIEVVKIRMQLQGELRSRGEYTRHYRNTLHGFVTIARNEGLRGIQKGLVGGLLYQGAMNGVRFGSYDLFRDTYHQRTGKEFSYVQKLAAAAASGALGAFVGSPLFLVKTQMQAESASATAVGFQHHHKGVVSAFRSVYGEHGIVGLWRGCTASVMRVMIGSAVQISTYSESKELVMRTFPTLPDGLAVQFPASMLAGLAVAVLMNPFDVVSVRLYNQPTDKHGKGLYYNGWFDAVRKMFKTEGFTGMYKGVSALYLRIGPHTCVNFLLWEGLVSAWEKYYRKHHPPSDAET